MRWRIAWRANLERSESVRSTTASSSETIDAGIFTVTTTCSSWDCLEGFLATRKEILRITEYVNTLFK